MEFTQYLYDLMSVCTKRTFTSYVFFFCRLYFSIFSWRSSCVGQFCHFNEKSIQQQQQQQKTKSSSSIFFPPRLYVMPVGCTAAVAKQQITLGEADPSPFLEPSLSHILTHTHDVPKQNNLCISLTPMMLLPPCPIQSPKLNARSQLPQWRQGQV